MRHRACASVGMPPAELALATAEEAADEVTPDADFCNVEVAEDAAAETEVPLVGVAMADGEASAETNTRPSASAHRKRPSAVRSMTCCTS